MHSRADRPGSRPGTTTLCAYRGSQEVHVIRGEATFPRALRVLDGDSSLPKSDSDGPRVIKLVKRLIGRRKDDPRLAESAQNVPNAHVTADDAVLMVGNEESRAEVISPYILGWTFRAAEKHHGRSASCVLTAPAYHSSSNDRHSKTAHMVGYDKDAVWVFDEPVTAVIDIGGGGPSCGRRLPQKTSEGGLTVLLKSTFGNDRVDGVDVDRRKVNHVLATRKIRYEHDEGALLVERKAGKRELLAARSILSIPVRSTDAKTDTEELGSTTKTQFEELCEPVKPALCAPLNDVTDLSELHVKDVVMFGGSSGLVCSLFRAIVIVTQSSDDAASSLRFETVKRNTQLPNQVERTLLTKLDIEIEIELREGVTLELSRTTILGMIEVPKLGTIAAKGTIARLAEHSRVVPKRRLSEEQLEEYRRRTSERLGDRLQRDIDGMRLPVEDQDG
ncbi:hypothetical protein ACHAQH_009858 [Verticillium albo-atrum]